MYVAIENFLAYLSTELRRSPNTIGTYDTVLQDFAKFLQNHDINNVDEITSYDIREWQSQHMENGEAATTTIKRITTLRSWFTYLRRMKLVDADVMAKIATPRKPHNLPIFFREKDVEKIYNADIFPNTFEGERDKLMLRMLYETGMRRSELVGLTEASIDLSGLTIKVLGKGNKERSIPIEDELSAAIQHYLRLKHTLKSYDEHLFVNGKGKGINTSMVYYIVRRYMSALSDADRISPHVFRHTFATEMLNEGANIDAIKELLGHSSLNATVIYTHVTREHLKEVYKHAHPRAKKTITKQGG